MSRNLQIATAAVDSTGLCLFVAFAVLDDESAMQAICRMLGGMFGREFSGDDFLAIGKETLARERKFNAAAGFTTASDRLPDFFQHEPLSPHDAVFDVPDAELDRVFDFVT